MGDALSMEKCYNATLKIENNVTVILKKARNNVTLIADDKSLTPKTEVAELETEVVELKKRILG